MIKKDEFHQLRLEIESAIEELFEYAKKHEKNKNDYILFLSRSIYDEEKEETNFSPWQVDNSLDEFKDRHRVEFLLYYLNQQYTFGNVINTSDSQYTLSLELMIYTHIWESFHNLKNLKKIADLCDSQDYNWNIQIGKKPRAIWIKENIIQVFEKHNLKIFSLIDEAYKNQLRNAFAHSLYHFSLNGYFINLENYNGKNIDRLTFDEWTRKFLISALIQNTFHNKILSEVRSLEDGKIFEVVMNHKDYKETGEIKYEKEGNRFRARIR